MHTFFIDTQSDPDSFNFLAFNWNTFWYKKFGEKPDIANMVYKLSLGVKSPVNREYKASFSHELRFGGTRPPDMEVF